MAKLVNDLVLDGSLDIVKNNATVMIVASGTPTSYATAVANALATKTGLTSGSFTGPADDTSGRKLTVNEQAGISIAADGTPTHICLTNGSDTLYYQTTCTGAALVTGNTVTVPAWKINIPDPT